MAKKKYTLLTMSELVGTFEKQDKGSLLELPRTADVVESIINIIDESCEGSDYGFHSITETNEGTCVVLKLKE